MLLMIKISVFRFFFFKFQVFSRDTNLQDTVGEVYLHTSFWWLCFTRLAIDLVKFRVDFFVLMRLLIFMLLVPYVILPIVLSGEDWLRYFHVSCHFRYEAGGAFDLSRQSNLEFRFLDVCLLFLYVFIWLLFVFMFCMVFVCFHMFL